MEADYNVCYAAGPKYVSTLYTNVNVCYFNFMLALQPWFYARVLLFVSDDLILFLLTYLFCYSPFMTLNSL